jgi:hypothetical protein
MCMVIFYLSWIDVIWLNQCACTDLMFHITYEDAFPQVPQVHHDTISFHSALVRLTARDVHIV